MIDEQIQAIVNRGMDQALAHRATDAAGIPICSVCSAPLGEREFVHAQCRAEQQRREELQRRQVQDAAELERRRGNVLAQLPNWSWCTVENSDFAKRVHAKFRSAAEKWHPSKGNLMLLGPTGTGKTASLIALVRRLVLSSERGDAVLNCHWTSGPTLAADWRANRFKELEQIERAKSSQVVVIDEIGFENLPADLWLEIMDHRYQHGLVTVTASGASRAQLRERMGDAIWRRQTQ